MTPGLAVLALIYSAMSLAGWITVLVVAIVRWGDTRPRLGTGIKLASVFLALSLPGAIAVLLFLDLSQVLPPRLPRVVYRLGSLAGALNLLLLLLSAAHLVLEVAVADMAVPGRRPFPFASKGGRRFAGWTLGALVGIVGAVVSAVILYRLHVRQGEAIDIMFRMLPKLREYSSLRISLLFLPTALAAAVAEEVLYRGVLQAWLIRWLGATRSGVAVGIAVTSFLWALPHIPNTDSVVAKLTQVFILGLLFGWLARRYSVEASMVAHLCLNLSSVIVWLPMMMAPNTRLSHQTQDVAPPARPSTCEPSMKPTDRDIADAVTFSRGSFDASHWTEDHTLTSQYARVTWRNSQLYAVANLDYLIYPCGYTAIDTYRFFKDETFKEVILRGHQDVTRTMVCTNPAEQLTLYEYTSHQYGRERLIRYWTRWDSNTRILTMEMVFPKSSKDQLDRHAKDIFPSLPACQ